jgi:hypothetical protein
MRAAVTQSFPKGCMKISTLAVGMFCMQVCDVWAWQSRDVSTKKKSHVEDLPFERDAQLVSNHELDTIRGGFLMSNGMVVDIGLFTQTIIDGVVVDEMMFKESDLAAVNSYALQKIIEVNGSGSSVSKLTLSDVPQLLTVIQNSRDNVVINNATVLNIDVTNASRFLFQTQIPLINHQIVNGLN